MDENTLNWVPGDWGNVTAGDRVRLEAADAPALAGTIQTINHKQGHRIGVATEIGWKKTETWQNLGWNLFVPKPTQPELPTEPGIYATFKFDLVRGSVIHLLPDGRWVNADFSYTMDEERVSSCLPLVRLLPEAETAKRIIARIGAMRSAGEVNTLGDVQEIIAAEFGVTLD